MLLNLNLAELMVWKISMNVFGNSRGLNLVNVGFGKEGKRGE
jgi:hypothetical protein